MTTLEDDAFVRLFQERVGLTPDGWAGPATIAKLNAFAPLPAKDLTGLGKLPDDYWPMLAKIESGGRPYVQAATSSASGLYQFIRATWEAEGGQWGPTMRPAFGGLKPTEAEQLGRAKSFTAKNAVYLVKAGIPINKASLYAAHFLGPVTAAKVIGADVNANAGELAGATATAANPSILRGKTAGDFLSWLHAKTGDWAR